MTILPMTAAALILYIAAPAPLAAQSVDQDGTQPVALSATDTLFGTSALDEDVLAATAGRQDTRQAALADQAAGVSNNSVGDHVRTGDASVADNAFQNLSGLSIVNINTGNNVAINAAMNVNIAIAPAP
ncbi:hypothetical protein [Sphingomonas sp.]|uniref:hypothetical protein n=1 Tax=Sphingomonas sp. TaxID=28214 RepID=UPI0035B07500